MNPFEMVAIIVVAVMIAIGAEGQIRRIAAAAGREIDPQEQAETLRLRDEVKQLKERIHVLERITVEKENSLSRADRGTARPLVR